MLTDKDTTTSLLYGVSAVDVAQVYMSPTPYNDAFEEELDLHKVDFSQHRAAGMTFLSQDNRLILISMAPSTPGAHVHAGAPNSGAHGYSQSTTTLFKH